MTYDEIIAAKADLDDSQKPAADTFKFRYEYLPIVLGVVALVILKSRKRGRK